MALRVSIILVAALVVACVGDSSQPSDAGNGNDATADSSVDAGSDAKTGPTTCIYGTSHFGDGCHFGP